MPKVSIIVPVYNASEHIPQCLDSLIKQTLNDIEIICIDDGSTDTSLDVLERYASMDSRIIVIKHEINQGVSAARNNGIMAATGQYVGFVDSDDFVSTDFYETLYQAAVADDADIAKGLTKKDFKFNKEYELQSNRRIKRDKFFFIFPFFSAIYRRAILIQHEIKFPIGYIHGEDLIFLTLAITKANSITIADSCYFYRHNIHSVSNCMTFQGGCSVVSCCVVTANLIEEIPSDLISKDAYLYNIYTKCTRCMTVPSCMKIASSEERQRLANLAAISAIKIRNNSYMKESLDAMIQLNFPVFYDPLSDENIPLLSSAILKFKSIRAIHLNSLRIRYTNRNKP